MQFCLSTALIAASFCLFLGIFAFVKNPRSKANVYFAFFNITLAIWNLTEVTVKIPNHHIALLLYRFCYVGGSFITFTSLGFMWSVAGYESRLIRNLIKL